MNVGHAAQRRIWKEIADFMSYRNDKWSGIGSWMVELSEDDNTFRIVIEGPPDSPYDEGIFYLSGI